VAAGSDNLSIPFGFVGAMVADEGLSSFLVKVVQFWSRSCNRHFYIFQRQVITKIGL